MLLEKGKKVTIWGQNLSDDEGKRKKSTFHKLLTFGRRATIIIMPVVFSLSAPNAVYVMAIWGLITLIKGVTYNESPDLNDI